MQADTEKPEQWRAIPGWTGIYEVSDQGRVRSCDRVVLHRRFGCDHKSRYRGRVLKPGYSTGYAVVQLAETGVGRKEHRYIHDLVLEAFVGPKPEGQEVCHGPGGARDNALTNLRYDTRSENALDRRRFGKGWAKRGWKKPTEVPCAVCGATVYARRRRDHVRLCGSPDCRSEWGRRCQQRKAA